MTTNPNLRVVKNVQEQSAALDSDSGINHASVLALMVAVRQLLELTKGANGYPRVNLYCNWCLHTVIEESNIAFQILEYCNQALSDAMVCIEAQKALPEFFRMIIGFDNLRDDLRSLFRQYSIEDKFLRDDVLWSKFLGHLLQALEGVPLQFPTPDGKRYKHAKKHIDAAEATARSSGADPIDQLTIVSHPDPWLPGHAVLRDHEFHFRARTTKPIYIEFLVLFVVHPAKT